MSGIFVSGVGAVSPAGWGVLPLREALAKGKPLPAQDLARPGWTKTLKVRPVPSPSPRPDFLAHPRLRRTSPITQYAVAAALEALGGDGAFASAGALRLGIILCVMTGCVNYSRRFYDETLKDPPTASPLVFPETVFNAPASHLAALLGTNNVNYTLVGDPGTFLQGLAVAADWLLTNRVDGCVVIGAEELDWLTADAYQIFTKTMVLGAGAGAVYLCSQPSSHAVRLECVTDAQIFFDARGRFDAAGRVRRELPSMQSGHLLCDGMQGIPIADAAESEAWSNWTADRLSPKAILGEGLAAGSAWQCVAAIDTLRQHRFRGATVSVVGCNEQAIAAHFQSAEYAWEQS